MFKLSGLVFVLFAIFFSVFSFNTCAQGAFITIINMPSLSPEKSTETPPSKDPREAQLESINQEINLLQDQIKNCNDWIQSALEVIDGINDDIRGLDPEAENFQEQLGYLSERVNSNLDSIKAYDGYIDANRTRVTELSDQRDKLEKDIRDNPFHPEETATTTNSTQVTAPSNN